jgi:hypothetical protein
MELVRGKGEKPHMKDGEEAQRHPHPATDDAPQRLGNSCPVESATPVQSNRHRS